MSIFKSISKPKETMKYPTDFKSKSFTYPYNALPALGICTKCFREDFFFFLLVLLVINYAAFVPPFTAPGRIERNPG